MARWILFAALVLASVPSPAARPTRGYSLGRAIAHLDETLDRMRWWWDEGRWRAEPDAFERYDWTRAMGGAAIHPMACLADGSPATVTLRLREVACFGMRMRTVRIDVSSVAARVVVTDELPPARPPRVAALSPDVARAWLRELVFAVDAPERRPSFYGCTTTKRARVTWSCGDAAATTVELVDGECDDTRRAARLFAVAPR